VVNIYSVISYSLEWKCAELFFSLSELLLHSGQVLDLKCSLCRMF